MKKLLLTSSIFLFLLVPFVVAQEAAVGFQLLGSNVKSVIHFINLFSAVLIIIFATAVARSAKYSQDAWGFIVVSTIFLALFTLFQVLKSVELLKIQGLGPITMFLFLILLLVGLYKLKTTRST